MSGQVYQGRHFIVSVANANVQFADLVSHLFVIIALVNIVVYMDLGTFADKWHKCYLPDNGHLVTKSC